MGFCGEIHHTGAMSCAQLQGRFPLQHLSEIEAERGKGRRGGEPLTPALPKGEREVWSSWVCEAPRGCAGWWYWVVVPVGGAGGGA